MAFTERLRERASLANSRSSNRGGSYQYVSACSLRTDMGKMYGSYNMENLYNKHLLIVQIPEFQMIAPFKMN